MIDLEIVRQHFVQPETCPLARNRNARLRSILNHKPSCVIVRERVQTSNARLSRCPWSSMISLFSRSVDSSLPSPSPSLPSSSPRCPRSVYGLWLSSLCWSSHRRRLLRRCRGIAVFRVSVSSSPPRCSSAVAVGGLRRLRRSSSFHVRSSRCVCRTPTVESNGCWNRCPFTVRRSAHFSDRYLC